jgi:hypothetical protein
MFATLCRRTLTRALNRRPKTIRNGSDPLRFRPGLNPLEDRTVPAYWIGDFSDDFTDPDNWLSQSPPASPDEEILFYGSGGGPLEDDTGERFPNNPCKILPVRMGPFTSGSATPRPLLCSVTSPSEL